MPTSQYPVLQFDPEVLLRAQGQSEQGIRAALLDVDGVFTDGGIYFSETGETLKVFHTLDGFGLKMLQQAGIEPVVITGRDTTALRLRLANLGVVHAYYGVEDKLQVAQQVMKELDLNWGQIAAIGDDWRDLPLLTRAAFAAAPLNAHAEVKAMVHYVTQVAGGHGALREFCDVLLLAGGCYDRFYRQWVKPEV